MDQISMNNISLLTLNDDCLMAIYQFLNLRDLSNIAHICSRLQSISAYVCARKFKEIYLNVKRVPYDDIYPNEIFCEYDNDNEDCDDYGSFNMIAEREFFNIWSLIGEHILKVSVNRGHLSVLESVRENCKNLKSLELCGYKGKLELQDFRHLNELKVVGSTKLTIRQLKKCFSRNPNIEGLEYDNWSNINLLDFIELLNKLPKLKVLRLGFLPGTINLNQEFRNLLHLHGLIKFSFLTSGNCNQLLIKLAEKLNLVELKFQADFDAHTFESIKLFQNLAALSMKSYYDWEEIWVSKTIIFPSKLKSIKLDAIKIACSNFCSIAQQCRLLEEFDVGYGCIYSDLDKCKFLYEN